MITFSTCWYIIDKAKFNNQIYKSWFSNLLLNVNNFYLIVYTDEKSKDMLLPYINDNKNIKLIILPQEEFYNYRYKEKWEQNHDKNNAINRISSWHLNMLWAEKISFVKRTVENNYFNTKWFGWVDIGYFRGRERDIPVSEIKYWPNNNIIANLDKEKIHYANICNSTSYFRDLVLSCNDKNDKGLPRMPIPSLQISIGGGFFLIHKEKIDWWFSTFDKMLQLYFENNYVVKDDQMIILNCISINMDRFNLYNENNPRYDNWFMFQRLLK